jgi:hypothetical protein
MYSIWYFIGLLVLVYGLLITGAGIAEWISPPAQPPMLASLHMGVWWGVLMIVLGSAYALLFRPRGPAAANTSDTQKRH